MKVLRKMSRKNRNYVLVRFPIDDLEAQLETWYSEKRDWKSESISVLQTMTNRETGKEESIENTIPTKYYGILRNVIQRIRNCILKNKKNDLKNNEDETKCDEENMDQ